MKKCVFAGSFDPVTKGHQTIIEQSLKIFDEVVVAVAVNSQKTPLFSLDERLFLLEQLYQGESRVRVVPFQGAIVDLLKQENTPFYVRGIRDAIDLAYENRDLYASKALYSELCPVYLPAEQTELQISSTLIKNSVKLDKAFTDYLPQAIVSDVQELLNKKQ